MERDDPAYGGQSEYTGAAATGVANASTRTAPELQAASLAEDFLDTISTPLISLVWHMDGPVFAAYLRRAELPGRRLDHADTGAAAPAAVTPSWESRPAVS